MPEVFDSHSHSRLLRLVRRAGCLMVLGLFTTVTVAWTCALLTPAGPFSQRALSVESAWRHLTDQERQVLNLSANYRITLTVWEQFGTTFVQSHLSPAKPGASDAMPESFVRGFGPIAIPWLHGQRTWPHYDDSIYVHARGWPFRAVWCMYDGLESMDRISGGLPISFHTPMPLWYNDTPARASLPFRPLYLGLILNTFFYAALWLGLFSMLRFTNRSLRRRRGLCPACAYDLRGTPASSPCPECGNPHR